ncbi:MAG TPA: hypothetical protein VK054_05845 [Beutenbergiaceae bacterium]|nr:hypothetical protein [Beutenbergiaceae bacterium]
MTLDISRSIEPRSDQQNYDDYVAGPKTVTVEKVTKGTNEQPVEIHLVEYPGRPYKPAKSMRRVLVQAWGADASQYAGRRLTLYGDPEVRFGGQQVGGIRISHLSHLDGPLTLSLTVTRGKRAAYKVDPLPDDAPAPSAPTVEQVQSTDDVNELRDMWQRATPDVQAAIKARVAELPDPPA